MENSLRRSTFAQSSSTVRVSTMIDSKVLLDAAAQLESAARKLRRASRWNSVDMENYNELRDKVRTKMIDEARALLHAAEARIA